MNRRTILLSASLAILSTPSFSTQWSTPVKISPESMNVAPNQVQGRLASDRQGNLVAAWWELNFNAGTEANPVYTSSNGVDWLPAESGPLIATPDATDLFDIATDGKGTWFLLLTTLDGLTGFVSLDNGRSWTKRAETIRDFQYDRATPDLRVDDDGIWLLAKGTTNDVSGLTSSNPMMDWNDIKLGSSYESILDTSGNGRLVMGYTARQGGGGDYTVGFALSENYGLNFGNSPVYTGTEQIVNSHASNPPAIAYGGNGHWIAVYTTRNATAASGEDQDLLYITSTDDGATWSSPLLVQPEALTDGADVEDGYPYLVSDRQGTFLLVWKNYDPSAPSVYYSLWTPASASWSEGESVINDGFASDVHVAGSVFRPEYLGDGRFGMPLSVNSKMHYMELQLETFPTASIVYPEEGQCLWGNTPPLLAEIEPADWEEPVPSVLFEYKAAAEPESAWREVEPFELTGGQNPDATSPYFTTWDFSDIMNNTAETHYMVRAKSSIPGFTDPTPSLLR